VLSIRLARIGRKNLQSFRLVVQEKSRHPKSSKIIENLGSYDPTNSTNKLVFESEKIEKHLKNGAQPSDTVARLLLKNGIKKELVEKFIKSYTKKKAKKESVEKTKEEKPTEKPELINEKVDTDEKKQAEITEEK